MSDAIEEQAKRVAARVDADAVGFDPLTILTIFTTVLPLLSQCASRSDEPDPAKVSASIRRLNEEDPELLRRRTAARITRIRRKEGQRLTKSQALLLADAVIAEACESSPEHVEAFVRFCAA